MLSETNSGVREFRIHDLKLRFKVRINVDLCVEKWRGCLEMVPEIT